MMILFIVNVYNYLPMVSRQFCECNLVFLKLTEFVDGHEKQ